MQYKLSSWLDHVPAYNLFIPAYTVTSITDTRGCYGYIISTCIYYSIGFLWIWKNAYTHRISRTRNFAECTGVSIESSSYRIMSWLHLYESVRPLCCIQRKRERENEKLKRYPRIMIMSGSSWCCLRSRTICASPRTVPRLGRSRRISIRSRYAHIQLFDCVSSEVSTTCR